MTWLCPVTYTLRSPDGKKRTVRGSWTTDLDDIYRAYRRKEKEGGLPLLAAWIARVAGAPAGWKVERVDLDCS